jgi:hypothetical protein
MSFAMNICNFEINLTGGNRLYPFPPTGAANTHIAFGFGK